MPTTNDPGPKRTILVRGTKSHREQMERLECAAYALLKHDAGTVPETLDSLTSKERHSIYKMPRLRVVVFADEPVEITGIFGGPS